MTAYYNENDPKAAAWLCELMKQGHIAPGFVDTRSIEDVKPSELDGFTQCHFFAGIGVWSYALRQAGWPDDRPVWTGSCPCQPFSSAGKRGGVNDERHLWPAFHWLIEQCRPVAIFGEQVASKDGLAWLDLVQDDLENTGYASGAVDLCASGFGAPHIRQRLFWVAQPASNRCAGQRQAGQIETRPDAGRHLEGQSTNERGKLSPGLERTSLECARGLANPPSKRLEGGRGKNDRGCDSGIGSWSDGLNDCVIAPVRRPSQTNGFWGTVDWHGCRDGKWRPVEPGTFPLADGPAERVVRLRGYGNAIVAPVAIEFVRACLSL